MQNRKKIKKLKSLQDLLFLTILIIPNHHPEPHERWTLKGLYDLEKGEILVGDDFGNFVASDNIYNELLGVFQEVGEELRDEVDEKFAEFQMRR